MRDGDLQPHHNRGELRIKAVEIVQYTDKCLQQWCTAHSVFECVDHGMDAANLEWASEREQLASKLAVEAE